MKNKILVIFTGGTIGSTVQNGAVSLSNDAKTVLLESYEKKYGKKVLFEELHPIEMLSENVQVSNLETLSACIHGVDFSQYDGIIVTHGTDTLSFTANYLSQTFADIPLPLVLVSAAYPLSDERSNGIDNFRSAVVLIRTPHIKGVFVSYKNLGEPCKIHLGSRLTAPTQIDGRYDSLSGIYFGTVENGKFIHNEDPRNVAVSALSSLTPKKRKWKLSTDVVTIEAHALLDFGFYSFEKRIPKALILKLYHSGTVCTERKSTNAKKFARYCRDLGIEVVLAPVDSKANVYASMKNAFDDCVKAYDISNEMTLVKVMLALGSGVPIAELLAENRFFEKI